MEAEVSSSTFGYGRKALATMRSSPPLFR
jgi:hypothetical protein